MNPEINAIVKRIVKIISLGALTGIILNQVQEKYDKGIQDMEEKFDMNLFPVQNRLKILKEYSFDNIQGLSDYTEERLRKEIMESTMKNETLAQMSERIKNVMSITKDRAILISRTEGNRAENFGRLDGALQAPVELKKWLSITKDNRTSPISLAMDKKYGSPDKAIPLSEDFEVEVKGKIYKGPAPPFHPNERDVMMLTSA